MAARLDSVAKFVCEKGNWTVSNLQLQKILYLAQMLYMGENDGDLLFDGRFEAWDFGPVEPNLYHRVKTFGANRIEDVFFGARPFSDDSGRKAFLEDACPQLLKYTPSELVAITHWKDGAWARHYEPGIRGIVIPDEDIYAEFKARTELPADSRASARG